MKKTILLWAACGVMLVGPAALYAAEGAAGGLADTDHDFTNAAGSGYTTSPNVGLCTFCHTPHKAASTQLLWNHNQTDQTPSYSWSDMTTTSNGTSLPGFTKTWKGPTPKCLSCHDGSVAIGDVNWFDEEAQVISISKSGVLDGSGKLIEDSHLVGSGGDLKGNHPVVVPYPGTGTGTYNGVSTGVPSSLKTVEWRADPTALGTWGVVLYKDDGSGNVSRVISSPGAGDNLGIECASCHDPHNKETVDEMFLRGEMTGNTTDYLCLKCHKKES